MNEKRQFSFHGEGGALLWLYIRCMVLTALTLGIYWPWAKARILKFHYGNTSFGGSTFGFQGTGWELFLGLWKGIGILLLVMIPYIAGLALFVQESLKGEPVLAMVYLSAGLLIYLALVIPLVPVAVNSSLRYRFGRTTWRSIRWAYNGKNKELLPLYVKGTLLTLITLTIYSSWFNAKFYNYIYSKLHFGSVRFRFKGDGKDLFFIGLKGLILSVLTLGIYLFRWVKDIYRWTYENIEVLQGEKVIPLQVTMTGGGLFKLTLVNMLLLVFTLGIAAPWVNIRTIKFIMAHIQSTEDLDVDAIEQTPLADSDATGEELSDFLDLGDWGIL